MMRCFLLPLVSGLALGCASPTGPVDAPDEREPGIDDSVAPLIEIHEPAPASFLEGRSVVVSGRVIDESPVELDIGDEHFAVAADGRFRVEIPLAPGGYRLPVVATDAGNNRATDAVSFVLGSYASLDEPVRDGVAVSLGHDVFETASRLLERTLSDALYDVPLSMIGDDTRVTGIAFSSLDASLTPVPGAIRVAIDIRGLRVFWQSDRLGGHDGEVTASRLTVSGMMNGSVVDGALVTEVPAPRVVLDDWELTVRGLLGFVGDFGFVQDLTRGQVERSVLDGMHGALDLLAAELRDLAMRQSAGPGEPGLVLSRLDLRNSGMLLALDVEPTRVAEPFYPDAPGYLAMERAPADVSEGVSVSLAFDAVNANLYDWWQAGSLTGESPGHDAGTLLLLAPDLGSIIDPDGQVAVTMDAVLPPTVVPDDSGPLRYTLPELVIGVRPSPDAEIVPVVSVGVELLATVEVDAVGARVVLDEPTAVALTSEVAISEAAETVLLDMLNTHLTEAASSISVDAPEVDGVRVSEFRVTSAEGWLRVAASVDR